MTPQAIGAAPVGDDGRLPATYLPARVQVADDAARFALTAATVVDGALVEVLGTGMHYLVVNPAELNSELGYADLGPAGPAIVQVRRGTASEIAAATLEEGELGYATDTKQVFFGDGATAGNHRLLKAGDIPTVTREVHLTEDSVTTSVTPVDSPLALSVKANVLYRLELLLIAAGGLSAPGTHTRSVGFAGPACSFCGLQVDDAKMFTGSGEYSQQLTAQRTPMTISNVGWGAFAAGEAYMGPVAKDGIYSEWQVMSRASSTPAWLASIRGLVRFSADGVFRLRYYSLGGSTPRNVFYAGSYMTLTEAA